MWKSATIIPIYQGKGLYINSLCYRPINLCSTLEKIFERFNRNQILGVVQADAPIQTNN